MKRIVIFLILVGLAAWLGITLGNMGDTPQYRYRVATADKGNISQVVTAIGTLNPVELISVGTQVSGQITRMHVQVSDEVTKGQLLAEMDPSLLEAQLKQSKTSLQTARYAYEQSQRDLQRTKMLFEKNYVAKVEVERAEQSLISSSNAYESAKAQVERDEVNLGYSKITSPIDGVVIAQEVTMGQTVAANFQTPNLFKIAGDLTKMKIDVNFSEADISHVKMGQQVKFTVDAFPRSDFKGTVKLVNLNPSANTGGVTYSATVEVNNEDKKLLPGMTAYVSVILSEKKNVLRIPAAALRFEPPIEQDSGFSRLFSGNIRMYNRRGERQMDNPKMNATIYIFKDGQPQLVEVKTGKTDEVHIEIMSGNLKPGDKVITGLIPVRSN